MKYCDQCGAQLNDTAKFCSACGSPSQISESSRLQDMPQKERESETDNNAVGQQLFGGILIVVGVALLQYGNKLNNSLEAQFDSLLSSGSTNPGTPWLTLGAVGAVLGLILLVAGLRKK